MPLVQVRQDICCPDRSRPGHGAPPTPPQSPLIPPASSLSLSFDTARQPPSQPPPPYQAATTNQRSAVWQDDLFIELWEESAWGSLTRTAQTTGSNRLGFVRFPLSSLCSSVKLAPGMHDLCRQDGRGEMPPVPLQVSLSLALCLAIFISHIYIDR